jgi:hypothetical protein
MNRLSASAAKSKRELPESSRHVLTFGSCQTKAKRHLGLSQKSIAMSYLRSKKQLEDVLDKRVGAAEQLRTVLHGIEQAKGNVEVRLNNLQNRY